MKLGGAVKGDRWGWIEGVTAPVKLKAGDFYLVTDRAPYCFATDPGMEKGRLSPHRWMDQAGGVISINE